MAKVKSSENEFRRWRALNRHLLAQMEEPSFFVSYINRLDEVASLMTIHRWLTGQSFPSRSKRPLVAKAIGCEHQDLEDFLKGIIPESAFLKSLPDVPEEYRRKTSRLTIDVSLEHSVVDGVIGLFRYLSNEKAREVLHRLQKQYNSGCNQASGPVVGNNACLQQKTVSDCASRAVKTSLPQQSEQIYDVDFSGGSQAEQSCQAKKLALLLELCEVPLERLENLRELQKVSGGGRPLPAP